MPRKPDYKREKKQREAAQRKRNEEAQQRKAARKSTDKDEPTGGTGTLAESTATEGGLDT
jgi:hypothetical protein